MSLNYYAIGQRIKEYRKRSQLSQAMRSELIDKSSAYVSYIESGNKSMSLETFVRIANALEIPTDLLLSEQLNGSIAAANQEITMILSDCSDYERVVIVKAAKTLKTTLREHRYLLKLKRR